MRVAHSALTEIDTQGFTIVEGVLSDQEVKAAREGVWKHHPHPEEYFAARRPIPGWPRVPSLES